MQAVPLLVSVVSLLMFFMFLFGIAGVMLFSGAAHFECISIIDGSRDPTPSNNYPDEWGCGGARKCPANYTCQASSAWIHAQLPQVLFLPCLTADTKPQQRLRAAQQGLTATCCPARCWAVLAPHRNTAVPGRHTSHKRHLLPRPPLL